MESKMNKLLLIIMFCSTFFVGTASAHGDHGVITDKKALSITATLIKKMTFKDVGFDVGKLTPTWKNVDKSQLSIVSVADKFYVVSALNPSNDEKLYFQIAKNGRVNAVKNINDF